MSKRNHKAPGFLLARIVLYFVGAATAAFGIAGWIVPELPVKAFPDLPWAALVLAGLTALSAGVVPFTCEVMGRSFWSVLLIPAALVFGGINACSFHHAVDALIEQPHREAHHREVVAPLQAKLEAAAAAARAHKAPVFPDTMGPKNVAARTAAWEAAHKPLLDAETKAQAAVDAAPAYTAFAPNELVWAVAAAIDISLAFGLAGIALTTGSIQKRIDATKAKRPKRKPAKARTAAPVKGFTPYVATRNP